MIEEVKGWAGLVSILLSIGAVIYAWLTAGSKQAKDDIAALNVDIKADRERAEEARALQANRINEALQSIEDRLLRVESDLTHLPGRDQWHGLQLAIERLTGKMETLDMRMTGRMDTLDERLKPVQASSARIVNILLEKAGEKE